MPRTDGSAFKSKVLSRPEAKNAVIASARMMGSMAKMPDARQRSAMKAESWQALSWNWYDLIGEFRFSVDWVGNIMSKARLTVTYDGEVTDNPQANSALVSLFGGLDGQADMLRQLGIHLTVAGDSYIIASPQGPGELDEWLVAAATETSGPNSPDDTLWKVGILEFPEPLVIRLWKPHPRWPLKSSCPSHAVLPILAELDGLTKHVAATIDSRLASAGILFVPSEISFGSSPSTDGSAQDEKSSQDSADALVAELIRVASTAIANRGDASALVPIVAQVAGEFVDKIKLLEFWGKFDEQTIALRQEAIRRLALGMDMPPEVLEGTSDMNHWSSWQVEEASIKSHSEPLLDIITSSLATGYLRPLLIDDGMDPAEAARYSFGYDDSKMRLRPNRSKEAFEMYDRGELSGTALLRENGFDVVDAMGEEERMQWFLRKIASGSTTPLLVEAALRALKVPLGVIPDTPTRITETIGDPDRPTESQQARPIPSLTEHPKRAEPAQKDAVIAASEMLVFRAIERAGNKLRTKMSRKISGVTAFDTYKYVDILPEELEFLLANSWDICDRVAGSYGVRADEWRAALDSYTRELLLEKREQQSMDLATAFSTFSISGG